MDIHSKSLGGHQMTTHSFIAERVSFTEEERHIQRSRCRYLFEALPVLADFSWARVRSRVGVSLLLIQIACKLILQTYLPKVGLSSISCCAPGVLNLLATGPPWPPGFSTSATADEAYADALGMASDNYTGLYYAYFVICLAALHSWNWPIWIPVGASVAWATYMTRVVYDGAHCLTLAAVSPPVPVIWPDGTDSPTNVIAFYNIYGMLSTLIIALVLSQLTIKMCYAAYRGQSVGWFETYARRAASATEPAAAADDECVHVPDVAAVETTIDKGQEQTLGASMARWMAYHLGCVPLRHIVATGLSAIGLVYFGLYFQGQFGYLLSFVISFREFYDGFDPNSPDDGQIDWYLGQFFKTLMGDATFNQIAGTLQDICTYAPYGVWAVSTILLTFLAYSLWAVNEHHKQLVVRYRDCGKAAAIDAVEDVEAGSGKDSAAPLLPANAVLPGSSYGSGPVSVWPRPTAPDLRWFSFFGATQYIVAHLVMHLTVALVVAMVITVLTTVLVIYLGGFAALGAVIVTAFRSQIYNFAVNMLPRLFFTYVLPFLTSMGIDILCLLAPFRSCYMSCCFCWRFDDGPVVILPRLFLAVDLVLTATLGVALGVVDGFVRIIMGSTWGLLRCALLHEPVVPLLVVGLDRPYMAYGGMLRSAHAGLLHMAAEGEKATPPSVPPARTERWH